MINDSRLTADDWQYRGRPWPDQSDATHSSSGFLAELPAESTSIGMQFGKFVRNSLSKIHISGARVRKWRRRRNVADSNATAGQLEIIAGRNSSNNNSFMQNGAPIAARWSPPRANGHSHSSVASATMEALLREPALSGRLSAAIEAERFDEEELLDRRNIVLERHASTMGYPQQLFAEQLSTNSVQSPPLSIACNNVRPRMGKPGRIRRLRKSIGRELSKHLPTVLVSWFNKIRAKRRNRYRTGDLSHREPSDLERAIQMLDLNELGINNNNGVHDDSDERRDASSGLSAVEKGHRQELLPGNTNRSSVPYSKNSNNMFSSSKTKRSSEQQQQRQQVIDNDSDASTRQRLHEVSDDDSKEAQHTSEGLGGKHLRLSSPTALALARLGPSASSSLSSAASQMRSVPLQAIGNNNNIASLASNERRFSGMTTASSSTRGGESSSTSNGEQPWPMVKSKLPRSNVINFAQLVHEDLERDFKNEIRPPQSEDSASNHYQPNEEDAVSISSLSNSPFTASPSGDQDSRTSSSSRSSLVGFSNSSRSSVGSVSPREISASNSNEELAHRRRHRHSRDRASNLGNRRDENSDDSLDDEMTASERLVARARNRIPRTIYLKHTNSAHRTSACSDSTLAAALVAPLVTPPIAPPRSATSVALAASVAASSIPASDHQHRYGLVSRSTTYNAGFTNAQSQQYRHHLDHSLTHCTLTDGGQRIDAHDGNAATGAADATVDYIDSDYVIRSTRLSLASAQQRRSLQFHPNLKFVENIHNHQFQQQQYYLEYNHQQPPPLPSPSRSSYYNFENTSLIRPNHLASEPRCAKAQEIDEVRRRANQRRNNSITSGETVHNQFRSANLISNAHYRQHQHQSQLISHRQREIENINPQRGREARGEHSLLSKQLSAGSMTKRDRLALELSQSLQPAKKVKRVSESRGTPRDLLARLKEDARNLVFAPKNHQKLHNEIVPNELISLQAEPQLNQRLISAEQQERTAINSQSDHKQHDSNNLSTSSQQVSVQPPVLLVNSGQPVSPTAEDQLVQPIEFQRVILQASTTELVRSLGTFLKLKCYKLDDFKPSHAVNWLRGVDKTLLVQGWQEIAFINPANVVFLYMMLRELAHENIETEHELQSLVMTSLYLAYAYMGNEISYPLQPFLCEQDNHENFWNRTLYIINLLSGQMLRLNADSSFFAEVFYELKSFEYISIRLQELDNANSATTASITPAIAVSKQISQQDRHQQTNRVNNCQVVRQYDLNGNDSSDWRIAGANSLVNGEHYSQNNHNLIAQQHQAPVNQARKMLGGATESHQRTYSIS